MKYTIHPQTHSILWIMIIVIVVFSCTNNKKGDLDIPTSKTAMKLIPSDNNPRNSEGDFINLKNGRILFIYSHFTGNSTSDHAPAKLAGRFSDDGGITWTSEDDNIISNEGDMNVMSVSLLRLQNNKIALFYLRKNSITDCKPMMRISNDEGNSWSDPIPIIKDRTGYFVLNNDRVIQIDDGRILLPVALHTTGDGDWKNQGDLYCYYSDDEGTTWNTSGKVPNNTDIVTQEPGLIVLKNEQIMMYIRASGGFQQLSYSPDRGETWSHIESSNIPSPLSPATIERIPGSDDWLMVWNNNDGSDPEIKGKRTPLSIGISNNEGKGWKFIQDIHDDMAGWYCYTAIHFIDNENLLLGYCAGNSMEGTHLSITNITRINLSRLYKSSN